MEEVISQAPENISKDVIESVFKKNNENVIDTLVELWNIEVSVDSYASVSQSNKTESTCENGENCESGESCESCENCESGESCENIDIHSIKNPEEKWTAIRNICDSYDIEMQAQLNRLKNRKYNNE
jgi:hypothetical protein